MVEELKITRISASSVYKLIALGSTVSFGLLSIISGIFALFGADTLTWNSQNIHGVSALVAGPVVGVGLALFLLLLLGPLPY